MPRSHTPYPPEFRRQMVELVRAGRTPNELAREFEPTAESIRNWVKQAEIDEGQRSDGLTTDEKLELARLRREIKLEQIRPRCRNRHQAYRCVANRWLAIAWKLWQIHQPYDEAYHFQQRLARSKPKS